MNLKNALVASLMALAIAGASVSSDAAIRTGGGGHAGGFHGGGAMRAGGGFHRGGGFRGGGVGFGLGALGLGLAAGAIASGAYYNGYGYDGCYRYRPIYNAYGQYVGRRAVNVCY